MATKFGFSSSYEFAVHVTNTSIEERETLLEQFYGVKSKKKSRGKSRSKEMYQATAKEDLSVAHNKTLPNGDVQGSRRKRNLPGTLNKDTRTLRTPIKRKPRGLQFEEESLQLPQRGCSQGRTSHLEWDELFIFNTAGNRWKIDLWFSEGQKVLLGTTMFRGFNLLRYWST